MNKQNDIPTDGWKEKSYPVKNDEVLALIRTWRSSSFSSRSRVLDLLINKLSYLVTKKIHRYRGTHIYEDLLQEGKLGLIKALNEYDFAKGPNFFKIAPWYIQNGIRDYLKWHHKSLKKVQNEEMCKPCSREEIDPYTYYENIERQKVLFEAVSQLPEMDRNVIMMRFGIDGNSGRTLKQIGDIFSLSRERIRQIESRALSYLKRDSKVKELCML